VDEKAAVGSKVSAIVAQTENDYGSILLTLKKPPREAAWEQLQEIADKGETINVKVLEANRGGVLADFNKIRGFIPSSHLISGSRESIGRSLSVKILEANKALNKLVFSEKEANAENLPKIELPFKIGDILDVKVSKILPFGLLVSLNENTEGLIHISEISWKRVGNLNEIYKEKDPLKAKVISIDGSNGRVNLSLKQLEKDPWQEAAKKYTVGSSFEKTVSRTSSYGVFVELEEGIEGLLHSSKIPYGVIYKIGDPIKVSIDLFNSEQRRVALRLAPVPDNEEKESKTAKTKTKSQPSSKSKKK
jgi:ribosomal protein S1